MMATFKNIFLLITAIAIVVNAGKDMYSPVRIHDSLSVDSVPPSVSNPIFMVQDTGDSLVRSLHPDSASVGHSDTSNYSFEAETSFVSGYAVRADTASIATGFLHGGTLNRIPYFLGTTTLGSSNARVDGNNIGIGVSSTVGRLHVYSTIEPSLPYNTYFQSVAANPSTNYRHNKFYSEQNITSNLNPYTRGTVSQLLTYVASGITCGGVQYTHENFCTKAGPGTMASGVNYLALIDHQAGTITNYTAFSAEAYGNLSNAVTNMYGFRFQNMNPSITIGSRYAFIMAQQTGNIPTVNFGIYMADTNADNYMAKNLCIGTTIPNGRLNVAGNGTLRDTLKIGNGTNRLWSDSISGIRLDGSATVWNDEKMSPGRMAYVGANSPTDIAWESGTFDDVIKVFQQGDQGWGEFQFPHTRRSESDVYIHYHWTAHVRGDEEAGATVNWIFGYRWASIDSVFPDMDTVWLTDTVSGVDNVHQMTRDVLISGTGKGTSSVLKCQIFRGTADTWAGTTDAQSPGILSIDCHYEINKMGSRDHNSD